MSSDKTYSLSDLAMSIQSQINKVYGGSYWISAEILKLNHYTQSGHCYPQLVEKKDGKIVADLKGFILSSRYRSLGKKFFSVTQKELADGMQIRFRCKVGFHPVYGLSLNILDIDPTHTLGEMTRLRNEARAKLKAENVFDLNKRKYLPLLVERIAVISVETSKGYGDFKKILSSSKYGKQVEQFLFPALVQGDAAVKSISRALESIQIRKNEFDAVAIIRGGGGETGLDCYDNYALSKLICQFPIPVLTGIGHSTNLTIVEEVANRNLTTPSELASFILNRFEVFENRVTDSIQRLRYIKRTIIEKNKSELLNFQKTLKRDVSRYVEQADKMLSSRGNKIAHVSNNTLKEKKYELNKKLVPQLETLARQSTYLFSKKLDDLSLKTSTGLVTYLTALNTELQHKEEKLRILDPIHTLKRGYSITYNGEKPLKNAASVKKGDLIRTVLSDGEIESKII